MRSLVALGFCAILFVPQSSRAADRKAIDEAVKMGVAYLSDQFQGMKPGDLREATGIGPAALAGLALLESGKPANDPTVKAIAAAVRDAAYTETRTYQISLCVFFLDRLGEPTDAAYIQMLAVRLLFGQNADGGWTYECVGSISKAEENRLRAKLVTNQLETGDRPKKGTTKSKPKPPTKKSSAPGISARLLPEVERHRHSLQASGGPFTRDDNSNTQFGLLAVWMARKHGVDVERSLQAIEKRYIGSQRPTGGWPYSGLIDSEGSPAMTCAGLLGLATAMGRREERRLKAEVPRMSEPKPKKPVEAKPDDPFFTPADPAPKEKPAKNPPPKKPRADGRDKAVGAAFDNLAAVLAGEAAPARRGVNAFAPGRFTDRDMYFLWSLERVGVIYGIDKIGKTNWYEYGADMLIPSQNRDGSWGNGGYGPAVNTSFALLFLARSNLVRDLSAKVQRDPLNAELRTSARPAAGIAEPPVPPIEKNEPKPQPKSEPIAKLPRPEPTPARPMVKREPMTAAPMVPAPKARPLPLDEESGKLADTLLKVPASVWPRALKQVRDGKGGDFTKAMLLVLHRVDGDRKKEVRTALEERLSRMSATTLRGMLKSEDVELRRAAILACAMKDDKAHIPDLIARLADDEDVVVRASRAALKSLSGGQDFGPQAGSTKLDKSVAVEQWKDWWAKQKK